MVRERLGKTRDKDDPPTSSRLREDATAGQAGEDRLHRMSFTRREIREFTGWSNYRVHIHLKELVEFEYVGAEADRVNNTYRYRLLWEGQGKDGQRFMLGLSNVEGLGLRDPETDA
jgi:hypothetical protein